MSPLARRWADSRSGAVAGRGYHYQDLVGAWVALHVLTGDIDAARSALAEGLSVALELGVPSLKFDAVESFAELLSAQGEVSCARRVLTYAADHPTANAVARDEFRRRLETLPAVVNATPPWPKLELDDLLHRIVVESNVAHAPLIDTLRGAH